MTIVVTGATGHLGRLAVESLLRRGVPADTILATGRNEEKLAALGVPTRKLAYEDLDGQREAFAGADRVLFVSGSEAGKRVEQHRTVVAAAKDAGVGRLIYTSIPHADTSDLILAQEHRATEEMIAASGVPYTFLRNSWYLENYPVESAVERGLVGAVGDGRISVATRADYAEAAAAALTIDDPKQVYELGGPGITMTELAALIAEVTGKPVTYTDLPEEKLLEVLLGAGLPEGFAKILADADRGAAKGGLEVPVDDLQSLLGRPPTPLREALQSAAA